MQAFLDHTLMALRLAQHDDGAAALAELIPVVRPLDQALRQNGKRIEFRPDSQHDGWDTSECSCIATHQRISVHACQVISPAPASSKVQYPSDMPCQ